MDKDILQQFQEMSALLNSTLDHNEIRRRAIEATTVVMDAEAGSLLLLDETTGELYFDVAHGDKGDAVREIRLRFGEGIAGVVLERGVERELHEQILGRRPVRARGAAPHRGPRAGNARDR